MPLLGKEDGSTKKIASRTQADAHLLVAIVINSALTKHHGLFTNNITLSFLLPLVMGGCSIMSIPTWSGFDETTCLGFKGQLVLYS